MSNKSLSSFSDIATASSFKKERFEYSETSTFFREGALFSL